MCYTSYHSTLSHRSCSLVLKVRARVNKGMRVCWCRICDTRMAAAYVDSVLLHTHTHCCVESCVDVAPRGSGSAGAEREERQTVTAQQKTRVANRWTSHKHKHARTRSHTMGQTRGQRNNKNNAGGLRCGGWERSGAAFVGVGKSNREHALGDMWRRWRCGKSENDRTRRRTGMQWSVGRVDRSGKRRPHGGDQPRRCDDDDRETFNLMNALLLLLQFQLLLA